MVFHGGDGGKEGSELGSGASDLPTQEGLQGPSHSKRSPRGLLGCVGRVNMGVLLRF